MKLIAWIYNPTEQDLEQMRIRQPGVADIFLTGQTGTVKFTKDTDASLNETDSPAWKRAVWLDQP